MARAFRGERRRSAWAERVDPWGRSAVGLETPAPPNGRQAADGGEAAPAEGQAASTQPVAELAAPVPTPKLPPIADKADDLEAIKQAVDDAAAVGGGLWLSYLFVLFYLAVAAGAVTHEDLFFERTVKLPFLNIELPLLAFFFLAPILFIIVHAYTLVHLVFLTEKAKRYHQALYDSTRNVDSAARQNLQWQLPSNIFIQFLAGPSSLRRGSFGWLLRAIAWVTLVIAPILLLLMMQVQFLPFHSSFITWTLRLALVVDLILIWWLWGKILSGREVDGRRRGSWAWAALACAFSLAAILFSGAAATFPGEWQEDHLPEWRWLPALAEWGKPATEGDAAGKLKTASLPDWVINAQRLSLHDWLFNEDPDSISRRRFPFSNTLVLPGLNIYEGLGIDDPEKAKWHDYVFRARGRDLRGAIFDFATLPKVDFESAELQGASFVRAQLQGARFDGAYLQGSRFDFAKLQGASLGSEPTWPYGIDGARLQGATFWSADLQAASLVDIRLQGAFLNFASLQGASLEQAQLQGASLNFTLLQGASLEGAGLQGAYLYGAQLQGASMQGVSFVGTDLGAAGLWRSDGKQAEVAGISFDNPTESWAPYWSEGGSETKPWGGAAYERLRKTIESFPAGDLRDQALKRIQTLDCLNPDRTLESCDPPWAWVPPLKLAPDAAERREALKAATVNESDYQGSLARILNGLVCGRSEIYADDDAIYIVRGTGDFAPFQDRLKAAGAAAIGLIDDLMNKDSKDCPVAAALTDADRAKLVEVKQAIEAAPKPPSGPGSP
jgi:uncharacterized protein YjbI with pentapeptide repeats